MKLIYLLSSFLFLSFASSGQTQIKKDYASVEMSEGILVFLQSPRQCYFLKQ